MVSYLMDRTEEEIFRQIIQRTGVISVAAILLATSAATGQAVGKDHELREAVSSFSKAYVAADRETLDDLLSKDYIHVNGGSGNVLDREEWLDWISHRRVELDAGRLVIEEYEVEDIEIRIHGEAAVVVGSVTSRERRDGEEIGNRLRFTNVWVRSTSGWRRAAFHDSSLR